MAANHFASGTCTSAPASVLHMLAELRERKSVIYGRSSQRHWEESALQQGVREVGGRLVFLEAPLQKTAYDEYETNSTIISSKPPL
jgi:hypothetical protein